MYEWKHSKEDSEVKKKVPPLLNPNIPNIHIHTCIRV